MSAFIVSDACMQKCVTAMLGPGDSCEYADELGDRLYAMNLEAVRVRYDDRSPDALPGSGIPEAFKWRVKPANFYDPRERKDWCCYVKALQCLLYQCTEGNVPEYDLYRRIERRINEIDRTIVSGLSEYQEAPWD